MTALQTNMSRILIAEDSASQAVQIQDLLESAGHDVVVVSDGIQAVSELEKNQTDVLVTDLMMPNMDGCELTRVVVDRFPHVPVVVITARGSESLAVDALADGAVNFIPKALLHNRLVGLLTEIADRVKIDQQTDGCGAKVLVPELVFSLHSQISAIEPVAQYVQRTLAFTGALDIVSRLRVTSAVASALLNAICYGNLGMVDNEEAVCKLIRGEEAAETEHKVRLVVSVGPQDLRFSVAHDGPGKITRTNPAPGTPQSFELEDCRGVLLITSIMDTVNYDWSRREIIMAKDI